MDAKAANARRPQPFRYRAEQWAKIEISVCDERRGSLTEGVREWLETAAEEFLLAVERRAEHQHSRAKKTVEWKNITRHARELQKRLRVLSEIDEVGDLSKHLGALIGLERIGQSMVESYSSRRARLYLIPKGYFDLRDSHPQAAEAKSWVKCADFDLDPMRTPRLRYHGKLLDIWTTKLDGELCAWWDEGKATVCGEVVEFFLAAAQPVMGRATPSAQTLPRIVRRRAAMEQKLANGAPVKMKVRAESVGNGQAIVSVSFGDKAS